MRDLDKDLAAYFSARAEVPTEIRAQLRTKLQAVDISQKSWASSHFSTGYKFEPVECNFPRDENLPVVWAVVPVALLTLIAVIITAWVATGNGLVLLLGVGYVLMSTTWAAAVFIMISLLNSRVARNTDIFNLPL